VAPQVRGRIFSIDVDPAVLDFVGNVVDPLSDNAKLHNPNENPSSRISNQRDRGFSFECFTFGLTYDDVVDNHEPLLPPSSSAAMTTPAFPPFTTTGNRLRGDSVIFDPTSFLEGGIHETSALMHIKQESINNEGSQGQHQQQQSRHEVILSASVSQSQESSSSVLPLTPSDTQFPPHHHFSAHEGYRHPHATAVVGGVAKNSITVGGKSTTSSSLPKLSNRGRNHNNTGGSPYYKFSKSSVTQRSASEVTPLPNNAPSSSRSGTTTSSQAFSDNTIHMPHGSDAAAAAAAGMPSTNNPSNSNNNSNNNNDGFSLSHTACPMELLNKGGRIGIYLPDERKARIAKFHSKREIRIWRKRIKYDCRKKLADSRPRIKGRFAKRSEVD